MLLILLVDLIGMHVASTYGNNGGLMLKPNDLVKYHIESPELNALGFELGRVYMVKKDKYGRLFISNRVDALGLQEPKDVDLTDTKGEFTDYADHVTMHRCPVVLPIGSKTA